MGKQELTYKELIVVRMRKCKSRFTLFRMLRVKQTYTFEAYRIS